MECPLCIEMVPENNIFQCLHCKSTSCISCMKTYLLNSTKDPHCYSCRTSIHYDIFIEKFDKTWRLGKYKKHKEKILWDNEVSLLPQTVGYIQLQNRLNECYEELNNIKSSANYVICRKEFHEANQEYNRLKQIYKRYLKSPSFTESEKEKMKQKLLEAKERYEVASRNNKKQSSITHTDTSVVRQRINQIHEELQNFHRTKNNKSIKTSYQWNQKCLTPDCKSFLDKDGNCVICHHKYCMDCLEDITNVNESTPHVCNEETKNTVKMIQKESKPCPNCNELISKISGCDQMFCTLCGTAFSWTTGHIELGIIHNPHANRFFENNPDIRETYLHRVNGNNRNQNPGCRPFVPVHIPTQVICEKLLRNKKDEYEREVEYMDDITYHHLEEDLLDKMCYLHEKRRNLYNFHHYQNGHYERMIQDDFNHLDQRVAYLNHTLSEKDFKMLLHKKYKRKSFITVFHSILVATSYIYSEFLWNLVNTERYDDFMRIHDMMSEVTIETNKIIENLLKKHNYKSKAFIINNTLEFPSLY